jgi:dCTP deaminase-like protein
VEVDGDAPFVLHPGEFVLGSTLERIRLPDDLVARLEGKALALDTPIPTPQGWRTMAELERGDFVFDEDGFPVLVLAATPPIERRPCREVVFSDGTSIVTDVDHQWRTISKNDRRDGLHVSRIVTTGQIAEKLRVRGEVNHHVPLAGASWYPERNLPIDPYVLGLRLGDGTTSAAEITCANNEILQEVAAAGYSVAPQRTRPRVYRVGPKFELQFTPDRPVFRLPRKLACQQKTGRFHGFRGIVDVREVPSVPVRCIEVSSPTGMFLASRAFVPTHNSSLGRLGLLIHSTAGFIDPGWDGHVTLELSNVANLPVTIYPGMKIGQISFVQLTEPAETPYGSGEIGSKYQGQRGPTPSRYWQNFRSEARKS